jgi:RNA-binding protein YlmH
MINIIKERLTKERIESTPSERPVPSNDSVKKFYIEPNEKTRVLDNKSFVEFVAETIKKTTNEASKLIKVGKVTVNRNIIIDENFTLSSGDVVRVGVLGHFLQGPDNISIVK